MKRIYGLTVDFIIVNEVSAFCIFLVSVCLLTVTGCDCKRLPVMLSVPWLPSLATRSRIFTAGSILIGPDCLKAPQIETRAVNVGEDILIPACVILRSHQKWREFLPRFTRSRLLSRLVVVHSFHARRGGGVAYLLKTVIISAIHHGNKHRSALYLFWKWHKRRTPPDFSLCACVCVSVSSSLSERWLAFARLRRAKFASPLKMIFRCNFSRLHSLCMESTRANVLPFWCEASLLCLCVKCLCCSVSSCSSVMSPVEICVCTCEFIVRACDTCWILKW